MKNKCIQRKILFIKKISFDDKAKKDFFNIMDFRNGKNHYLNLSLATIVKDQGSIKKYLLYQRGNFKQIDWEFDLFLKKQIKFFQKTNSENLKFYFETLNFVRESSLTPTFKLKMQEQNVMLNEKQEEKEKMLYSLVFFPEFIQDEKNVNKILMSISPIKFIYITVLFWLQSQKKLSKFFKKFHSIEFTLYMLWQFHSSKIYPSKAQA